MIRTGGPALFHHADLQPCSFGFAANSVGPAALLSGAAAFFVRSAGRGRGEIEILQRVASRVGGRNVSGPRSLCHSSSISGTRGDAEAPGAP